MADKEVMLETEESNNWFFIMRLISFFWINGFLRKRTKRLTSHWYDIWSQMLEWYAPRHKNFPVFTINFNFVLFQRSRTSMHRRKEDHPSYRFANNETKSKFLKNISVFLGLFLFAIENCMNDLCFNKLLNYTSVCMAHSTVNRILSIAIENGYKRSKLGCKVAQH